MVKIPLPAFSAICIDDGNTRCKVAIYRNGKLVRLHILPVRSSATLLAIKEINEATLPLIWSSVSDKRQVFQKISGRFSLAFEASAGLSLPLKNRYLSPGPGSDRLASAVAVHHIFKGFPALAIDAGTCLKFDFVNAAGAYLGGSISPGLQMRFDAMHLGTGLLPALKPGTEKLILTGNDTISAMRSGAMFGQVLEMEARIQRYRARYPKLRTVLTGGDLNNLPISLKKNIFAEPNLVLHGLLILLYHQPKIKALIHS